MPIPKMSHDVPKDAPRFSPDRGSSQSARKSYQKDKKAEVTKKFNNVPPAINELLEKVIKNGATLYNEDIEGAMTENAKGAAAQLLVTTRDSSFQWVDGPWGKYRFLMACKNFYPKVQKKHKCILNSPDAKLFALETSLTPFVQDPEDLPLWDTAKLKRFFDETQQGPLSVKDVGVDWQEWFASSKNTCMMYSEGAVA